MVNSENGQYVGQTGIVDYMVHQFKNFVGSANLATLYLVLRSSLSARQSTIYLQLYNRNSQQWETVDFDNATQQDSKFVIEKTIRDLSDYKDNSNVVATRVYQLAI